MDVFDAIFSRRAVRRYSDTVVPGHLLKRLLDAASQAPSAVNRQPCAFAVFRNAVRLADYSARAKAHCLATMPATFALHSQFDHATDPEGNIFYNASTLIVILAKPRSFNASEDCCFATQNLLLAAHALNLGTCLIRIARPWLNLPDVKAELKIPPSYLAVFAVTVGYPAENPPTPHPHSPEIICCDVPELDEVTS
jgi:nitroreductase